MKRSVLLRVNGERHEVFIEPNRTLLEVLRDELLLTGAKEACGAGECGACTVLIDGKPVNSCIALAVEAEGKAIETIEGLSKAVDLHPLQEAFIDFPASNNTLSYLGFIAPKVVLLFLCVLNKCEYYR